jgi:hypothetical protein
MNTPQAKFILQGYRPNGADAGDATFGDALEQTRHDLVLRDWFAREQSFDGVISAKLNEVQSPAGLREAILAGARVTASGTPRRSWWHQPVWMAAAASIAVIGAVTLALWPKPAVADSPFNEFVLKDARHGETHGGRGEAAGALQTLLSQPATRLGQKLPVDYPTLHATGCRTLSFEGHDLIEVCFKRNGVWFHCYVARCDDFPALAKRVGPTLIERNGMSMVSWADPSNLFVVVSNTGRAALEKLL